MPFHDKIFALAYDKALEVTQRESLIPQFGKPLIIPQMQNMARFN